MKVLSVFLLTLAAIVSLPAKAVPVDLELGLVIDTSNSVNSTEYFQQINGYRDAFNNAGIQSQIESLTNGIAVGVFFFNTSASEPLTPTWNHLTTAAESAAFAALIAGIPEPGGLGSGGTGNTDIAEGVDLARTSMLGSNGFEGSRLIIDVSGDGTQNSGCSGDCIGTLQAARDTALAAGIVINGLAIESSAGSTAITDYYNANLITAGGFVQTATFDNFASAVATKIGREICNPQTENCSTVPEPASIALLGLGLACLALWCRRRYL